MGSLGSVATWMAGELVSKSVDQGPLELRIKTDDELWYSLRDQTGIEIPRITVCPGHVAPFTAFADAFFSRSRNVVWHASRGLAGKSVMLAALAFMCGVEQGAAVNLLGGSGEQSQRVHGYMTGDDTNLPRTFWGHYGAPRHLLRTDPTKKETRLTNGGRIVVLQASTRSVRGPHPQKLLLDECDEMSKEIYAAASGQTMSARGIPAQTVMSSTHQYADGTFTEILRRAAEREWPVYTWCYKETEKGWLAQTEIDAKRGDVSSAMWETEYDLQEPNPGARAIDPGKVKLMFQRSLGDVSGRTRKYYEFEKPDPRARYTHGADWAKKVDNTIIITFRTDCSPIRLVAFERRNKEPWPLMIKRLDDRIKRYGGKGAHDATGLGDVIKDFLLPGVKDVVMSGRSRAEMLNDYVLAIEKEDIVSPHIEFMYSEHLYASVDDFYGGKAFHLPDTISAGALGYSPTVRRGWSRGVSA